ncbi:MAG TPA: hypothetical protein VMS64_30360 [Candidatus Methylomirabilis sp.]|nr:hypothetical protein [Candidatus Methylomirabilis sp.]
MGLSEHKAKRDGSPLAPRSVLNTASIVRVFLADALERKALRRDLCTSIRWAKYLPAKRDKVKGLRQRSFDLAQVVTLTADTRIPEDRQDGAHLSGIELDLFESYWSHH